MNIKIGFIGAGNMAEAMIKGLISSNIFEAQNILISDILTERLDFLSKSYGVSICKDNLSLFKNCGIIILAVKPQVISTILSEFPNELKNLNEKKIIISIAAGITIQKIENIIYSSLAENSKKLFPIVRVMPNTPALVLCGMSAVSFNQYCSDNEKKISHRILKSMGNVIEIQEEYLDAVTAISGSGPAYVFYFTEAMIESASILGLNPDDAWTLILTTLKGAAALMEKQNESPESLRNKVTSKGGTTEAAIKVLNENRVKETFIKAIESAAKRSKELSSL
ncbi:MAG: pyrroline-5-carboxylate reductase [Desulfobacterales bacterium]|nr:pyrroline-5-carboxylate reductase [Desulfobacterales bacterium]